jgi:hypothetical protein
MRKTDAIYGSPPVDLGLIDLSPSEMMFWLYCPIKLPGEIGVTLPPNLEQFAPLIDAVARNSRGGWRESYIYITAKTLWATPSNPGNRQGWHSDGFLTDDLNYIWADANPTVFFGDGKLHAFSADHGASLAEMDALCEAHSINHRSWPRKHLLRLDQTVLHKVATDIKPGVRTFVKISVSRHRYGLRGNSINHELAPDWSYAERQVERNCPIGGDT